MSTEVFILLMETTIDLLIQKYQRHLAQGEKILAELKAKKDTHSCDDVKQKDINHLWRLILKDLSQIADKSLYEDRSLNQSAVSRRPNS